MNNLSLIVAIGQNNEIGKDNKLLWHLPNDLKFFKEVTSNKTIIMGKNTFESLPKMLPNRKHIIISNTEYKVENAIVFYNIEDTLDYVNNTNEDCFIIGGMSIYEQLLPYAKYLYITKIEATSAADTFFPKIKESEYEITYLGENQDNNIKYKHYKYIRKD